MLRFGNDAFGGKLAVGHHLGEIFDDGGLRRDRIGRHHRGELVQHLRDRPGDGAVAFFAQHQLSGRDRERFDGSKRGARRKIVRRADHLVSGALERLEVRHHLVARAEFLLERVFDHARERHDVHRVLAQRSQHPADHGVIGRHAPAAHQLVGIERAQPIGLAELRRGAELLGSERCVDQDRDVARVVPRPGLDQAPEQREKLRIEYEHHVGRGERGVAQDGLTAHQGVALHRRAFLGRIEHRESPSVVARGDKGCDEVLRRRHHARPGRAEQEHLQLAPFDNRYQVLAGEARVRVVELVERLLDVHAPVAQRKQRLQRIAARAQRQLDQLREELVCGLLVDAVQFLLAQVADAQATEREAYPAARGGLYSAGERNQPLAAAGLDVQI